MVNQIQNKQPLLILYADGSIETPGAQTYGDILQRFQIIALAADSLQKQILATPITRNPEKLKQDDQ